ncbi:hypothetical protein Cgig2_001724 [Carnegiea gigantea]|uniref:DUF4005 domain-containing protein n=1 Tax=Carnegiea gigantea TaxID=171969 RepID=A0A9Q1GRH6_9CARY|nr:hypothetical protein Cgig2_001724 [Carnegiea gigantea]
MTGGSSWLTTVKRAFRSPTKKSCKRSTEEDDHGEKVTILLYYLFSLNFEVLGEYLQKAEKRRWIFRKLTSPTKQCEASMSGNGKCEDAASMDEQQRAIAAAKASTEAAQVAVKTAQAAVRSATQTRIACLVKQHYAALVIQTAFRGYLARQALRALKGIVKLQALVRGHNARKQAKSTLKCMQALIRVQAKMRNQCSRPLQDGTRRSMFAETNNLWDKYKDIRERNSITLDDGNFVDQWEDQQYTIEDIESMLKSKKKAALKREKALAYALSQQIRRFDRSQSLINEQETNQNAEWLKHWVESEQSWEYDKKSISQRGDSITDLGIESLQTHLTTPQRRRHSLHVSSPLNCGTAHQSPMTPSLCNTARRLHVQSASPRCLRDYRSHSTTTTPSLRTNCPSTVSSYRYKPGGATMIPNYMAATESAKAKSRSLSTPRHRLSMTERSERGCSVKKRLSYPMPESHSDCTIYNDYGYSSENLRSPSFRSVQGGGCGVEKGSLCSCYTDSTGGEVSPASTSHIRRWLS